MQTTRRGKDIPEAPGNIAPAAGGSMQSCQGKLGCRAEGEGDTKAKAPRCGGDWQCHGLKAVLPHLIQQLGPTLHEPEVLGARL